MFRGDNLVAQDITDPAWLLSGPFETGKTWAALWRLDQEARANKGGQYAIVRKVRNVLWMAAWRWSPGAKVIERAGGGVTVFGGEKPQWVHDPNGARVWVGGLDRPEDALGQARRGVRQPGRRARRARLELPHPRDDRPRRGDGAPMLFGDCNPGGGTTGFSAGSRLARSRCW